MDMDETGRNGGKWHLAQQITQHVIKPHIMQLSMTIFLQQITQPVIRYVLSSTTNPIPCDHDYHTDMGGFLFLL